MPKSSLYKKKTVMVLFSQIVGEIRGLCLSPKVNVIVCLELELTKMSQSSTWTFFSLLINTRSGTEFELKIINNFMCLIFKDRFWFVQILSVDMVKFY